MSRASRERRRSRRTSFAGWRVLVVVFAVAVAMTAYTFSHVSVAGRVARHEASPFLPTPPPEAGELGGQGTNDAAGNGSRLTLAATPAGPHITLPILVYHYIRVERTPGDLVGWGLSVTPHNFTAQMDYLRAAGAHTLNLAQVVDALAHDQPLPPRSVVLTFDDGYDDFATDAAPTLHRDGLIGTDFVVSGFVGRRGYMTQQQVRAVMAQGMVIGAHTVHHLDLSGVPTSLARMEIELSKSELEGLIGRPVEDFAYPYGDFNSNVEALVAAAGFRDASTMIPGDVQYQGQLFGLRRIRVGGGDTLRSFAEKAMLAVPSPSLVAGAMPLPPPASPSPNPHPASPSAPSRPPALAAALRRH